MPAPPPPIKNSNAPVDTIDVPDGDLEFENERDESHPRPIAPSASAAPAKQGASASAPKALEKKLSSPRAAAAPPPAAGAPPRAAAAPPRAAGAPPPAAGAPPPAAGAAPRAAVAALNDASDSDEPPSRAERYAAGDLIASKYRLKSVIGRGGMGSVWLAHNNALDIAVAIKLIRRDRAAPGAAERLRIEARAAARLRHPAIVRILDCGETERGDPFIVMELLHGESLSAIIARKGRLPTTVAVQTLLPVAAALVEAHAKGIVHRDLKPDNILLVTDESGTATPKIVDFGIAKLMDTEVDRQLTMAGEVLGSPDYMSPEQARGDENVGEGTDIWQLCVVLYEVITGRRPFDGPNYNALIAAILTVAPPPAGEFSDCDGDLWSIIARGLSKDLAGRWPTIRELGTALAAWAEGRGVDDDITGTSIVKQWTIGKNRRLFTVFPEGEPTPPPAPSRPSMEPQAFAPRPSIPDRPSLLEHAAPPPSWSVQPSWPSPPANSTGLASVSDEWTNAPSGRSRRRVPIVVLTAALTLGLIGYVAVAMIKPGEALDPAAPSASAQPTSVSPVAATQAPPPLASSSVSASELAPAGSSVKASPSSVAPPTSSAAPSTKSSAAAKPPKIKPKAPLVPKNINF